MSAKVNGEEYKKAVATRNEAYSKFLSVSNTKVRATSANYFL